MVLNSKPIIARVGQIEASPKKESAAGGYKPKNLP